MTDLLRYRFALRATQGFAALFLASTSRFEISSRSHVPDISIKSEKFERMRGNTECFRRFLLALPQTEAGWFFGEHRMDRHDQELLDKQMGRIALVPRNDGIVMLALTAVFFAGLTIGGFLYAYTGAPIRAAAEHASRNQQIASSEVPIFVPQSTIRR